MASATSAYAGDREELGPGGAQDLGRSNEMGEELSETDGAEMFNEVKRHQGVSGFHAEWIARGMHPHKSAAKIPKKRKPALPRAAFPT